MNPNGSRRIPSLLAAFVLILTATCASHAQESPAALIDAYRQEVDNRLDPPPDEILRYGTLALDAVSAANGPARPGTAVRAQYVAVVDRNPEIQALFIYWLAPGAAPLLIGASPVSTGHVGRFDYFETPTGTFDHTLANPDFRAEGTKNEFGVRGYGAKGMRVFDLGWQLALRGWGPGGLGQMRLQMHATDPVLLEQRLGSVQSKGCIRIPASLNRLLDQHGVLDADYEAAEASGQRMWVLRPGRTPVAAPGRYVVVVDTARTVRPDWSPTPAMRAAAIKATLKAAAAAASEAAKAASALKRSAKADH